MVLLTSVTLSGPTMGVWQCILISSLIYPGPEVTSKGRGDGEITDEEERETKRLTDDDMVTDDEKVRNCYLYHRCDISVGIHSWNSC